MSARPAQTPYGYPEPTGAPFPTQPPWDTPIAELAGWWIENACPHEWIGSYPIRLLAAKYGWNMTLREVLPRVVCSHCGQRPIWLALVSNAAGEDGRHGAKVQRVELKVML